MSEKYIRVYLGKKRDARLLRRRLKDKGVFHSVSRAIKIRMYRLMEEELE